MRKVIVPLLLAIAAFSIGSLLAGASYLEQDLVGTLPIGNALAAMGPCSLAAIALLLSSPHSACRTTSLVALLASVLWLPVSVVLAGNLALNFSGARGTAWIAMTLATIVVVLVSLVWAAIGALRPHG